MNIRRLLIPMAVLAVCGLGVSAPAFAGEVSPVTASQSQAPRFQLSWTEHDGLITGGSVKLTGASVRIQGMDLVVVGTSGKVLEVLPGQVPDATGKPVNLLYDISNPNDLVFRFVPMTRDRGGFSSKLGVASFSGFQGAGTGVGIGSWAGYVIGGGPGFAIGGGIGLVVGGGIGVIKGICTRCR